MEHQDVWDEETARSYDTPGVGMFAADVVTPAVDRLVALAAGGRVLEFAIGTGRIAVPLRERGVDVAGVELSQPMIDQLRQKVSEDELSVVRGDMATATVRGSFSLVVLVYNGISNLLTQAEQVACFRNAARHLDPGGRFVIELWVPPLRSLPPGQRATVFKAEPDYVGFDTYDVVRQRVVSHHVTMSAGRQARVLRSPHRYVWPAELDLMAQLAGFTLESRSADWLEAPFTESSASHVSVYRLSSDNDSAG